MYNETDLDKINIKAAPPTEEPIRRPAFLRIRSTIRTYE